MPHLPYLPRDDHYDHDSPEHLDIRGARVTTATAILLGIPAIMAGLLSLLAS